MNETFIKQENKIILLSILGICFAFLGWSDVVSDFLYHEFSDVENIVLIISVVGFLCSSFSTIANIIIVKISDKNPKVIFLGLLKITSALAIVVGLSIFVHNVYIFSVCYVLYIAFVELLSMYHFAFESSTTEETRFIQVENKRKTLFKILTSASILVSNFLIVHYGRNGFLVTTIVCALLFLGTYFNLKSITCKRIPKKKEKFLQKLHIKKYSKKIKLYGISSMLTKFALSNITIVFSMMFLKNNMPFEVLKDIKNYAVIFAIIGYFIVKKANLHNKEVTMSILTEIAVAIAIFLAFWNRYFLILVVGLQTIHNLVELAGRFKILENDTYKENRIEKNAIIDIGVYASQACASVILLNLEFEKAIGLVGLSLVLAVFLKIPMMESEDKHLEVKG